MIDKTFYREWLPEKSVDNHEVVLCLHGVESHSEWFNDVALALAERGFAVFAYDRAGWGQSAGLAGDLSSYTQAINQLCEIVNQLREKYTRVHLVGLSWGAMFALYTTLRRVILFDSLTLIAPGICPKQGVGFWAGVKIAAYLLTRQFRQTVPLNIDLTHFTNVAEKTAYLINDKYRTKNITAGFAWETLKMRKFCHEFCGRRAMPPSLLLLAGDDKIIDNTATRALFFRTSTEVEEIPFTAHSLVFECPERVANAISRLAQISKDHLLQPKKIAVLGAGAVGSFIAGMLALGGNNVTLIGRDAQVDAINRDGLLLKIGGAMRKITARENLIATTKYNELKSADLLIIAVKSFSTASALAQIAPYISPSTVIVGLQNGIHNEEKIATQFPNNPRFAGVISAYLDYPNNGVVECADDKIGLAIGGDDNHNAKLSDVAAWLRTSRIEVVAYPSARSVKWSKLMLNVAFNALNAATGLSAGQIMAHPEYGNLAAQALKEAFAVMRAEQVIAVDLPNYPVRKMEKLCYLPTKIVAKILAFSTRGAQKTISSMRQDLRKKSPHTEIDDLNGTIVAYAEKHNLPATANRQLCKMVRECAKN